jgi:hypothetical protein
MPGSGEGQRKRSVTATAPLAYLTVAVEQLREVALGDGEEVLS